jgi:DNA recombination protein RmuC
MHEAGIVEQPLPSPQALEAGPRVLTAMELIEAATADAERPQLAFEDFGTPARWTGKESTA